MNAAFGRAPVTVLSFDGNTTLKNFYSAKRDIFISSIIIIYIINYLLTNFLHFVHKDLI